MNMKTHPTNIKPTRAGHSTGRWEGDTLVVDTVGFLPGVLNGTTRHGDKLHVVERFTLDPKTWQLNGHGRTEDRLPEGRPAAITSAVMPATRRHRRSVPRNKGHRLLERTREVMSGIRAWLVAARWFSERARICTRHTLAAKAIDEAVDVGPERDADRWPRPYVQS